MLKYFTQLSNCTFINRMLEFAMMLKSTGLMESLQGVFKMYNCSWVSSSIDEEKIKICIYYHILMKLTTIKVGHI